MFSTNILKRFAVLSIMLVGLVVLSLTNRVGATPCCDACMAAYNTHIAYCYNPNLPPGRFEQCVIEAANNYEACSRACGNGVPACLAV